MFLWEIHPLCFFFCSRLLCLHHFCLRYVLYWALNHTLIGFIRWSTNIKLNVHCFTWISQQGTWHCFQNRQIVSLAAIFFKLHANLLMVPIFRVINKTERYQLWQLQNEDTNQGRLSKSLIKPRTFSKNMMVMVLRGKKNNQKMWLAYCQGKMVNSDEQYTIYMYLIAMTIWGREEKREYERKSVVHLMSGSDQCKCRTDRNKGQLLSNPKHMLLEKFLETCGLSALPSHLNSVKVFPFSSLWTYSQDIYSKKLSCWMKCFSANLPYIRRHKAIFWTNLPQSPSLSSAHVLNVGVDTFGTLKVFVCCVSFILICRVFIITRTHHSTF